MPSPSPSAKLRTKTSYQVRWFQSCAAGVVAGVQALPGAGVRLAATGAETAALGAAGAPDGAAGAHAEAARAIAATTAAN